VVERITPEMFGRPTAGHEARYALAAGFVRPGDVVVDAACGIGYGALLLDAHGDVTYYGVDRDTSIVAVAERPRRTFIEQIYRRGSRASSSTSRWDSRRSSTSRTTTSTSNGSSR
jgi:predicted RNA methylase